MSIEPYRFSNGQPWGEVPEKTPDPALISKSSRGRAPMGIVLRNRRARTDPNWKTYSETLKRKLIDLDRKEGHW